MLSEAKHLKMSDVGCRMADVGTWVHRYAVCLAVCTLALIVAGAMVTSTGSGLSVPDWPTTYGYNMFTFPLSKWVGGIFYEHSHRLIASGVGMLTIGLAVLLWRFERRRWLRRLGLVALGMVILQGILGGITVRYLLPAPVSIFHGCLAQAYFCTIIAIAVFTSRGWVEGSGFRVQGLGFRDKGSGDAGRPLHSECGSIHRPSTRTLCIIITGVIFIQLILGAVMRHTGSGLAVPDFPLAYGQVVPDLSDAAVQSYNVQRQWDMAWDKYLEAVSREQIMYQLLHRGWAIVVSVIILSMFAVVRRRHADRPDIRRSASMLVFLLVFQLLLGASTIWSGKAAIIASGHVAVGALTLGIAWRMTLQAWPRMSAVVLAGGERNTAASAQRFPEVVTA